MCSGWRLISAVWVLGLALNAAAKNPETNTIVPWKFAAKIKDDLRLDPTPGLNTYQTAIRDYQEGKFSVYVPKAYRAEQPMPLLVSSHGAGGSGPGEVGSWVADADKYGFIVVCPSYQCATVRGALAEAERQVLADAANLREILERVFASLNIERRCVLHTGFSGGGVPTWYIAMNHPEVFTALCFRSANFYYPNLLPATRFFKEWSGRPIYTFWGDRDHPLILTKGNNCPNGEGPTGLEFLKTKVKCTKLKSEVIPGGGHDSRPDLAAKCFSEDVVPPALARAAGKPGPSGLR